MSIELIDRKLFRLRQDIQSDFQGAQGRQQMGTHKVRKRHPGVRLTHEQRPSGVQIRHALAGEIIIAQQAAAIFLPFQRFSKQQRVKLTLVHRRPNGIGKLGKQPDPGVNIAGAVVAVNHGNRKAGRHPGQINTPSSTNFFSIRISPAGQGLS